MDYCLECYLIDDIATEGNIWNTMNAWYDHSKRWRSFMKEGKKLYKSGDMSGAKEKFKAAAKEAEDLKAFIANLPQDKVSAALPWIMKSLVLMWNIFALANISGVNKENKKSIANGEINPNAPWNAAVLSQNRMLTAYNSASVGVAAGDLGYDIVNLKKNLSKIRSEGGEIKPNDYNSYLNMCKSVCNKLIAKANDLASKCG